MLSSNSFLTEDISTVIWAYTRKWLKVLRMTASKNIFFLYYCEYQDLSVGKKWCHVDGKLNNACYAMSLLLGYWNIMSFSHLWIYLSLPYASLNIRKFSYCLVSNGNSHSWKYCCYILKEVHSCLSIIGVWGYFSLMKTKPMEHTIKWA